MTNSKDNKYNYTLLEGQESSIKMTATKSVCWPTLLNNVLFVACMVLLILGMYLVTSIQQDLNVALASFRIGAGILCIIVACVTAYFVAQPPRTRPISPKDD